MTEADFRTRQRQENNDTAATAVYADALYDGWRDDALTAISRYVPQVKTANLSIVDGTLTYDLPSDWITSTTDEEDFNGDPVFRITTAADAVLLLHTDFRIQGRSLVLASDPDVTATWVMTYGGTWPITAIPRDWIEAALDYATARAYEKRAADAAQFFSFTAGPDTINRSDESARWLSLRTQRLGRFSAAMSDIAAANGASSSYGSFDVERA